MRRPVHLVVALSTGCAAQAGMDATPDHASMDAVSDHTPFDSAPFDASPMDGSIDDSPDGAVDARVDVPSDRASPDAGPPITRVAAVEQASGRVLVFDTRVADWSNAAAVTWSWAPTDSPQIATAHRAWFGLLSDIKLKSGGATAIVAASDGGVAIIRVADRAVTFYADQGGNPHAVELLPDGNLVGVSSTGGFVRLYVTDPAVSHYPGSVVSIQRPVPDAHGVYWDAAHTRLLVLGGTTLFEFVYGGSRQHPTLTARGSWPLPSAGGHDLYPVPATHRLFVTTGSHVYEFDADHDTFATSPLFPDRGAVKSLSVHPTTGQVVFTTPRTSWWTDTIDFYDPSGTRVRTGAHFYKARWWYPAS